jgi:hypothetical protein
MGLCAGAERKKATQSAALVDTLARALAYIKKYGLSSGL